MSGGAEKSTERAKAEDLSGGVKFSDTGRRSMDRWALLEEDVLTAIECPVEDKHFDDSGVIVITGCVRRDLTIGVHFRYCEDGTKEVLRVFRLDR